MFAENHFDTGARTVTEPELGRDSDRKKGLGSNGVLMEFERRRLIGPETDAAIRRAGYRRTESGGRFPNR